MTLTRCHLPETEEAAVGPALLQTPAQHHRHALTEHLTCDHQTVPGSDEYTRLADVSHATGVTTNLTWRRRETAQQRDGQQKVSGESLGTSNATLKLGDQICTQNGSDWPRMGYIRDFSRSESSSVSQNVLKSDLKSPRFVPFRANLTHFGAKPTIPAVSLYEMSSH